MSNSKKILYLITKSDVGGAQKYVGDLTTNLDKANFQVKIFYGGKDLKWLSNAIWPWLLFLNDWLAIWELMKLYEKEQPHVVHLNSSKAGVLGSLAAFLYKNLRPTTYDLRPKIVFTAHGWVFNPTNAISPPIRWFYILLHKLAALFKDKIICVSEYDYNLALRYHIAPKEKLAIIHNGIDPNIKFLEKSEARKEITNKIPNSKFQIPNSNYPWVGSIGRLVKEKNYETFIQTAALIPNANFLIIGSGPEKEKLIVNCQLSNINNVFFIEPTGNDAQYLKAFDIFTMSSIKEGLPYILLEAMAAELPIVVTEAGGMPEVIKNHENGLMVSQKNPEFMAKAIQGLLTNPNISKELGQASNRAVIEKFNLAKMILETSQVYS